jgi:hypothetical protein
MKRYPETKSKYLVKYTAIAALIGVFTTAILGGIVAIVAAYIGK